MLASQKAERQVPGGHQEVRYQEPGCQDLRHRRPGGHSMKPGHQGWDARDVRDIKSGTEGRGQGLGYQREPGP